MNSECDDLTWRGSKAMAASYGLLPVSVIFGIASGGSSVSRRAHYFLRPSDSETLFLLLLLLLLRLLLPLLHLHVVTKYPQ